MRLRGRLILTIAAASVVPIVGATLVGREWVQLRSRAEFEDLLGDGEVEVRARFRVLQEDVARSLQRLADADDQFTGPILIALANGGPDDDTFRQLALVTPRVMQERGLDVLTVLGPKGEILASGHFPGRMGDIDPRHAQVLAAARRKAARLVPERILQGGKPATQLTVQAWRLARSPLGSQVVVMGGRVLGPDFVRTLRLAGGTEVLVQDAAGRLLAGPSDWQRYVGYPHRVVRLADEKREAARITLAVPDDRLRATLRAINRTAIVLVVSGLMLSLLLGALAALQISRRLREVVAGAEAVAAGDLDKQLTVRGRDEVGELVETFNRMTSELKESKEKLVAAERLAAWQEIARRIAHEIKNPLFPIQTSIETLRKTYAKHHPDFEEIFNESTTMILEEVQRLKNIVTEFSQFARLPKPNLTPCDLRELLPSVVSLYGGGGDGAAEIPIVCELPEGLPQVMADREQLTQVFVNLIKNAREALAGAAAPQIRIIVAAQGEAVEVSVQDNGPGFDEAVGVQIFTPYFTTKGASGGTGLGLAIVHRIVTDHGGKIEARSQPGQGATFVVRLARSG
jgi:two-component system, NtrC family, nitrogen regulation sensor histidine kinase NtrY